MPTRHAYLILAIIAPDEQFADADDLTIIDIDPDEPPTDPALARTYISVAPDPEEAQQQVRDRLRTLGARERLVYIIEADEERIQEALRPTDEVRARSGMVSPQDPLFRLNNCRLSQRGVLGMCRAVFLK